MDKDYLPFIYLIASVIGIVIYYQMLIGAVASGMKKTNQILEQQNKILLKWLNHQGFDTKELENLTQIKKKA